MPCLSLPILTYGCEVWTLSEKSLHTVSVVWNNCFRRIFRCCWRESTRPLQYYCNALPMSYLIDQRRLLFWQKTRCSNNVVLRTLSALKNMFVAIGSKYDISSYNVTVKPAVWNAFAMSLESVLLWYFLFEYAFEHIFVFIFFSFSFSVYLFYCIFYCLLPPSGVTNDDETMNDDMNSQTLFRTVYTNTADPLRPPLPQDWGFGLRNP